MIALSHPTVIKADLDEESAPRSSDVGPDLISDRIAQHMRQVQDSGRAGSRLRRNPQRLDQRVSLSGLHHDTKSFF